VAGGVFRNTRPRQHLLCVIASRIIGVSHNTAMWDAKRQFIWLAAGLVLGTFVAWSDAHDEDGTFVPRFFIFMESLVLIIIAALFYIYSRKNR
jgi:hypothetical protein